MRYIIGIGGAGGVLASQAYKKIQKAKINDVILLNFSTSLEDALNISEVQQTLQVIQEGAGKNFSAGEQMWEKNFLKITKYFLNQFNGYISYNDEPYPHLKIAIPGEKGNSNEV